MVLRASPMYLVISLFVAVITHSISINGEEKIRELTEGDQIFLYLWHAQIGSVEPDMQIYLFEKLVEDDPRIEVLDSTTDEFKAQEITNELWTEKSRHIEDSLNNAKEIRQISLTASLQLSQYNFSDQHFAFIYDINRNSQEWWDYAYTYRISDRELPGNSSISYGVSITNASQALILPMPTNEARSLVGEMERRNSRGVLLTLKCEILDAKREFRSASILGRVLHRDTNVRLTEMIVKFEDGNHISSTIF